MTPPPASAPADPRNLPLLTQAARQRQPARWISWPAVARWVLLGFAFFVLLGLLLPLFGQTCVKGTDTRELAQSKQIGLALRLYAEDHDGVYPAGANLYGETIRTSNDAFRSLFPTYVTSENIFGRKVSGYQTAPPDNVITPPQQILRAGENTYSYVMGETSRTPDATPLVVDATDGTGLGLYVNDPQARGGARSANASKGGGRAILIRHDTSGALVNLTGPANALYMPASLSPEGKKINQLSPAALGPDLKLLDPAVVPPETR